MIRALFDAQNGFFARHPKITITVLALIYAVIDYSGDFQP